MVCPEDPDVLSANESGRPLGVASGAWFATFFQSRVLYCRAIRKLRRKGIAEAIR